MLESVSLMFQMTNVIYVFHLWTIDFKGEFLGTEVEMIINRDEEYVR